MGPAPVELSRGEGLAWPGVGRRAGLARPRPLPRLGASSTFGHPAAASGPADRQLSPLGTALLWLPIARGDGPCTSASPQSPWQPGHRLATGPCCRMAALGPSLQVSVPTVAPSPGPAPLCLRCPRGPPFSSKAPHKLGPGQGQGRCRAHVQLPLRSRRFAKLLLRLPALRSIGLKCLEHLFFFKLIGDTPIDTFLMEMLEAPHQMT